MARKWSLLFRAVESFLRLTSRILTILWRGWGYSRLVVVMLLGIFILTAGMPVVLSQMTGASQIAQSFGKEQKSGVQDIKSQIQEVKKLQDEGLYYTACKTLIATVLPFYAGLTCDDLDKTYWQEIKNKIDAQNNDTQVIIWFYFGEIMRVIGDLEKSEEALNNGLKVAKNLSSEQQAVIYLSLANTFRAKGNLERDRRSSPVYDYMPWQYVKREEIEETTEDYNKAQENYKSAIDYSSSSIFRFIVQANLLSLLIERNQFREAQELSSQIYSQKSNISEIPENLKLKVIYAQINFAKSLAYLKQISEKQDKPADNPTINWDEILSLLTKLQKEAKKLNSKIAESYVLGNLGGMYEYLGKLNKAQKATEEALYLAQPSEASDIAYQWQWQMGRLLKQQGKIKEAIASYEAAVKTLESVRGDLLAINSDVQFSFRDNVEPLYRELVDLLLKHEEISIPNQENIKEASQKIDKLQLAELQNFLRCNLSNLEQVKEVKKKDPKAAIIYSIILKKRLVTIYELPGEENLFYKETPNLLHSEIEHTLKSLRNNLKNPPKTPKVMEQSRKLYQWIIKPLENNLKQYHVETLVFVQDGYLRNIPMAVLYDEEKREYLLEKNYAIALAPRLQLFSPQFSQLTPSPSQQKLKVFIGGVDIQQELDGTTFSEIENLIEELEGIPKELTVSKAMVNTEFTKSNIQQRLKSGNFSAIHWKTHGQFSSDPDKTFIVAYKERIKAKDLNNLIQVGSKSGATPLELVVLSACETATGDNRAVLGLAGIAVRTGARSVISTLWKAEDAANTEFMIRFYQELLKPGMTKAQAVHKAQIALKNELGYTPHLWANYILIGNWL
ncbi:MAG: CHAT domain-containing protein [Gloeotrichia echinulata HAB0833]